MLLFRLKLMSRRARYRYPPAATRPREEHDRFKRRLTDAASPMAATMYA